MVVLTELRQLKLLCHLTYPGMEEEVCVCNIHTVCTVYGAECMHMLSDKVHTCICSYYCAVGVLV